VIISAAFGVIDGVAATSMSMTLEQAQLAHQLRVNRQAHQASREQRDGFKIDSDFVCSERM
jgi:hypothetical protein